MIVWNGDNTNQRALVYIRKPEPGQNPKEQAAEIQQVEVSSVKRRAGHQDASRGAVNFK